MSARDITYNLMALAWVTGLGDVYEKGCTAEQIIAGATNEIIRLTEVLEQLARLGNGDQYGNSDGNMIARKALGKG